MDAIVAGNARVAGGEVEIGPATMIEGGASVTGGRVEFDGSVTEYLQVTGGDVRLNGVVGGDAIVRSGELHIGPGTRIDGKLVYRGPDAPVVPEGASIAGGVEFHESSAHRWADRDTHVVVDAGRAVGSLVWFVGVFAVAALFTAIFPAFSTQAATLIGRDPWVSLGLGLAVLVCVPFLFVVLLITIIGIPLALLLVPAYLLLMFLGWVTAALFRRTEAARARASRAAGQPGCADPRAARGTARALAAAAGSLRRSADRAGGAVRGHRRAGLAVVDPARAAVAGRGVGHCDYLPHLFAILIGAGLTVLLIVGVVLIMRR